MPLDQRGLWKFKKCLRGKRKLWINFLASLEEIKWDEEIVLRFYQIVFAFVNVSSTQQSLYCTPWIWGVKNVSPEMSLCLLFQNLWAKNVCSQVKEFSQVEPSSLSLKTKPHEHQTISTRFPSLWARSGLITWGDNWNCSEVTFLFIYGSSFLLPKPHGDFPFQIPVWEFLYLLLV